MPSSIFARLWRGRALRAEINTTFALALPLMLGELSSVLMGVAGTMMAGQLGETALAASGIGGVVFVLAMLIVWGSVRMIPTPVAEAHELRDGPKVKTLFYAGLVLAALLTVVCVVFLWLGVRHFDRLGQDPEVAQAAVEYLHVIIFSLPVLILFAVLVNMVDAFTYVRATMFISFLGLALDVLLNWLFMFGKFGLPAMGIRAIAMNTGISHAVMSLLLVAVLVWKKELHYFRVAVGQRAAIWSQTRIFIRQGIPSALQMMVEFGAFGAGTVIIGQISKTEQAAHQIAINLISLTYVTIMGVSTAGMIRIGQALAYQSRIRVWLSGIGAVLLAMLIMTIPTIVFLLAPEAVVQAYTQDRQLISFASSLVFLAGLFQLADAAQASSISLLRALNDIRIPALISLLAFWVVGLPLGYWLAMYQGWHAKGIWVGYLVALLIQALLFMRRFLVLQQKVGRSGQAL